MRALLPGLIAFLTLAAPAFAEEKQEPAKPRTVQVIVGQTVRLQMTSKRPIKTVINDNDTVIRVVPTLTDPTTILIVGLTPGSARLILIDVDGKEEIRDLGKPAVK